MCSGLHQNKVLLNSQASIAAEVRSPSWLHKGFYMEYFLNNAVCPQENLQALKAIWCCCLPGHSQNSLPIAACSRLWGRNVQVASTYSTFLPSQFSSVSLFTVQLSQLSASSFCFLFANTHFCLLQDFPNYFFHLRTLQKCGYLALVCPQLLLDVSDTQMQKALFGFYQHLLLLGVKIQFYFLLLSFHLEWLCCCSYVTFGLNKLLSNAQIPRMCTEEVVLRPEKYLERARFYLPLAVWCNKTSPKEESCCVHKDLANRHTQRAWESREWFADCRFWSAQ